MSPSFKIWFSFGIPCTTTSLTDVQSEAGKGFFFFLTPSGTIALKCWVISHFTDFRFKIVSSSFCPEIPGFTCLLVKIAWAKC